MYLDMEQVPALNKPFKEKLTLNLDMDVMIEIRAVADLYGIPYSRLMNELLKIGLKNCVKPVMSNKD